MPQTSTLKTTRDLLDYRLITHVEARELASVSEKYAISITPEIAKLIDPQDPQDPIALQFIPQLEELQTKPYEMADPIADEAHSPVPGVVHRYPDRALLKLFHSCPVYCRFCFRREMVGPSGKHILEAQAFAKAHAYLASHPEIWEVILTGGDPLMLSARRMGEVCAALGKIPHLRILRIHTRVPLVDPTRITDELVTALAQFPGTVWLALHANHAKEFTPKGRAAVRKLANAGIAMVSQSVLLKGVNDTPEALRDLMRCFVENRVKPYYLHHLDAAPGTDHFRVPITKGLELLKSLRGFISGLCQPDYMLDLPGGYGKVSLREQGRMAAVFEQGMYYFTDYKGEVRGYGDAAYPLG